MVNKEIINYFEGLWENRSYFMKKSGFFGTIAGAALSLISKIFKDKSVHENFENLFNPYFK
jgi:hypothetical protein